MFLLDEPSWEYVPLKKKGSSFARKYIPFGETELHWRNVNRQRKDYVIMGAILMNIFSFSFPIGWDELAACATTIAVIVALFANKKSTKQLKYALKMQEQSKNIELFEKRVALTESIIKGGSISSMALRILFTDEISTQYQSICDLEAQYKDAQYDATVFFQASQLTDADGYTCNSVKDKIEEYEGVMSRPDCPESIFEQFKQYCDENEIFFSATGYSDDRKTYNYSEISCREGGLNTAITSARDTLARQMEEYISESIKPVSC